MVSKTVSEFITAAKQDEGLRQKLKAAMDMGGYIKVAQERGYDFTAEDLQMELNQMPEEDVAELVNPGIGPRRHIEPQ